MFSYDMLRPNASGDSVFMLMMPFYADDAFLCYISAFLLVKLCGLNVSNVMVCVRGLPTPCRLLLTNFGVVKCCLSFLLAVAK